MTGCHLDSSRKQSANVGLVWFYGISFFEGYLTPNPFLCKLSVLFQTIQFSMSTQFVKNISISNNLYYLIHSLENKEVQTFPHSKVKVIARLEFELAWYDSAVHRCKHYTTRTSSHENFESSNIFYINIETIKSCTNYFVWFGFMGYQPL